MSHKIQSASSGGYFQPVTLDVDEQIMDRNLTIISNRAEDELGAIFTGLAPDGGAGVQRKKDSLQALLPEPNYPSVQVTPEPGMCVKTKSVSGEKVFINLCKIQEIPPAPPLSEEKLQEIILSEDYSSDFRVPMSLGAPRKDSDKSGQKCLVCDVAINSVWYKETMVKSLTFTTFVINVAMEGLCDKYGDQVNLDRQNWTILKNKKYHGSLQRHHIQQRPGQSKIQELNSEKNFGANRLTKPLVTELKEESKPPIKPDVSMFQEGSVLRVEIHVPGIRSGRELFLDVGEDRVILTSNSKNKSYRADFFVPFKMVGEKTRANFHLKEETLHLEIPVIEK